MAYLFNRVSHRALYNVIILPPYSPGVPSWGVYPRSPRGPLYLHAPAHEWGRRSGSARYLHQCMCNFKCTSIHIYVYVYIYIFKINIRYPIWMTAQGHRGSTRVADICVQRCVLCVSPVRLWRTVGDLTVRALRAGTVCRYHKAIDKFATLCFCVCTMLQVMSG